jgi:1-acyl-sn-glycerol-3-phosphate acyltransferase
VSVLKPAWEEGRLLRWLHTRQHVAWGTDPGEFRAEDVKRTLPIIKRLFGPGRYFGLDVRGWEHVPDAPAMIVSNHSGGTSIPDVWGFLGAWYQNFGVSRPIHPMAHEFILSTQVTGEYFARRGVLRGSRDLARAVLVKYRRDLMVMPGGDVDTWRPYSERYNVRFGGRTGYARLALESRAPIVPLAHAGAHETLIVLSDGRRLADALHLRELARASIWPVHLSLPWGLAIGPWPHIPTPALFRYRIGPAILPPPELGPDDEPSEAMVVEHDARVRASVQSMLDDLKATARGRA